jgi:4-amino-4-deoxy-L-arabinose transferase-like glycosyltransferase
MDKINFKSLFGDIRFWILLFFVLRMFGITDAPLESGHSWRQALTNMMARNFLTTGPNLFYPTIDMYGEKSGIIASEFPFFNYLIYLFSYVFGYAHWYGRLINLVVSSFGLFYFYKLVLGLIDKKTAYNATIVLLVSIWLAHSRKSMPDTFSVSLVIIGLYYGYNYLKEGIKSSLLLFFLFCSLGMLCKIPAFSLFSVVAVVIFIKSIPIGRRIILNVVAVISAGVVYLWYFNWVPYLLDTYKFQLFFPKNYQVGTTEIAPLIPELLEKFYFSALCSFLAFACCLVGLILLLIRKSYLMSLGLLIICFVFGVFIIKTGAVFPTHSYYIIPFVPVMALAAGYFISKIPMKYQSILLVLIAIEGIANQQHDFFIKENQLYKLELEAKTDSIIPKKDLIIINGGESPQDIYFANRKGWTVEPESISNLDYIDSLSIVGAKYLIVDLHKYNFQLAQYPKLFEDNDYSIYKLNGQNKK